MSTSRNILVVSHTGREESLEAAREVCQRLGDAGLVAVMVPGELADVERAFPDFDGIRLLGRDVDQHELELVVVLGGDGTILRAAELVRGTSTPLLGVNLGHVGFLAESERDGIPETIARVIARDYLVEERMTLTVVVKQDGEPIYETWALNEVSLEKGAGEKMIEVALEVDQRPLSSFACDGVVMSTPTGSTAYAFSAGGPIVWPTLDALLLVPLNPHSLFPRPLVVGPNSSLAVEVLYRSDARGVLWADGRRTIELPDGARVIVRRSPIPVRLARLHEGPFTDRLVQKFNLPVTGWRGGDEA
jgi:NAD+ kinase